jgi:large subunit ribosomal protein L35
MPPATYIKWDQAQVSPAERLQSSNNERTVMPKMKTKKSASKRFEVRASGSIKRGQAAKRHLLTKRKTKNKRHLRGAVNMHGADVKSARRMMPYA